MPPLVPRCHWRGGPTQAHSVELWWENGCLVSFFFFFLIQFIIFLSFSKAIFFRGAPLSGGAQGTWPLRPFVNLALDPPSKPLHPSWIILDPVAGSLHGINDRLHR